MMTATTETFSTPPYFALNIAQGRFGVAYMQALCAQAGFGHTPTPPDEDVAAIDGQVRFLVGSCAYQVKCTTKQFGARTGRIAWPIGEREVARWAQAMMPVYFVIVQVGKDQARWIDHPSAGTTINASAYWTKVDVNTKNKSISVVRTQRLSADTLHDWAQSTSAGYGAVGS